jgi:threonine synthase
LAHEGLWQEYSGAAAIAALREARQRGERFEAPVVAVLTSTGLKEVPAKPAESSLAPTRSLDQIVESLRRP